ncbi:hypothetical protein [Agreia pratensis]|uniref:hypothetical protein n=1 Tax=Agreia pratensis TaxID=150121 RepID=UPI000A1CF0C1|nr:hypothetical protein [Agreia pratensis]
MGDFTSRHGGSWSRRFETLLVAQLNTGRNARRLDATLGGTRPADPAPGLAAASPDDIVPDPDIDPAAGNLAAARRLSLKYAAIACDRGSSRQQGKNCDEN